MSILRQVSPGELPPPLLDRIDPLQAVSDFYDYSRGLAALPGFLAARRAAGETMTKSVVAVAGAVGAAVCAASCVKHRLEQRSLR